MKPLHCLLFIFIIIPCTKLFSQPALKKSVFSISAGPSLPLSDFAKTGPSDQKAGFAGAGQNLNLSYTYYLNQNLGIVGMIYGERNPLNTNAMAAVYNQPTLAILTLYSQYSNWVVKKSSWLSGSAMLGVSGEFNAGKSEKVSIIGKALTGLAFVRSPEINATSKSERSYAEKKRGKNNVMDQSLFVSGGVKYVTGKRTTVTLSGDLFSTRVTFQNVTETFAGTNGGLIIPGLYTISNSREAPVFFERFGDFKPPVTSLNINIGFSISL